MRKLLFGLLLGVTACASAAAPPPEQPYDAITWPASLPREASKGASFGNYRITFEKTTLAQVRRAISVGSISVRGDAGESILWLCYTISDRDRIWITSSGEMGGTKHVIAGISAQRLAGLSATPDCPSIPKKFLPISLDRNVWLGSSIDEIDKAVGSPSHVDGEWRSYDYEAKVPGHCEGGYDFLNSLLAKTKDGIVVELFTDQVTSC